MKGTRLLINVLAIYGAWQLRKRAAAVIREATKRAQGNGIA